MTPCSELDRMLETGGKRRRGDTHWDTLLLAPLCDCGLELCVFVLAERFLQEVGAVDSWGVLGEEIAVDEAEGEMLELELEGEVEDVLGVCDGVEQLVLADAAVDAGLRGTSAGRWRRRGRTHEVGDDGQFEDAGSHDGVVGLGDLPQIMKRSSRSPLTVPAQTPFD